MRDLNYESYLNHSWMLGREKNIAMKAEKCFYGLMIIYILYAYIIINNAFCALYGKIISEMIE